MAYARCISRSARTGRAGRDTRCKHCEWAGAHPSGVASTVIAPAPANGRVVESLSSLAHDSLHRNECRYSTSGSPKHYAVAAQTDHADDMAPAEHRVQVARSIPVS